MVTNLDKSIVVSATQPKPWPTAAIAAPNAPPRIERIWLSDTHLRQGGLIHGAIATTTNVASVEVRTATFSINTPRRTFGQFAFVLKVLMFPPLLKHTYPLQIIARNAAGAREVRNAYLVVQ